jgi:hypothetical protein
MQEIDAQVKAYGPENFGKWYKGGSSNTVIKFGGGILPVPARTTRIPPPYMTNILLLPPSYAQITTDFFWSIIVFIYLFFTAFFTNNYSCDISHTFFFRQK